MRHLIACCDGTWNTEGDAAVTNVRRVYSALADTAEDGNEQIRYYHAGVRTTGGLVRRILGGGFGVGLPADVMTAYHWLTTTYRPGDRIVLFGFSRGAFTARSLAGMISKCGLLDTTSVDDITVWHQIEQAYRRRYRAGLRASPHWRDGLRFCYDPDHPSRIPVYFVGVWDTVGSLGIPDHLGLLNLVDRPQRYAFHDLTLNRHIRHARHAIAIDERRGPFAPTLWEAPAPGQDVKQVWFPGSHKDVGGGHVQTGLSDGALQWMIEEARDAAGLGFHKATLEQIRPNPVDVLHDDDRGVFGVLPPLFDPLLGQLTEVLGPRPRAVPLVDPHAQNESVHRSAYERQQNPPLTGAPYRPTRVLAPGESATVRVSARAVWNDTGLYLEAGAYTFGAEGAWQDAGIWSGPAGTTGLRRFLPVEGVPLLSRLGGVFEPLFRRLTRNPEANIPFTRRAEDLPWMSLVGVVANAAIPVEGARSGHERIPIGAGTGHRVVAAGYLYAFANDAWGCYANNRGELRLTVTRTV